MSRWCMGIPQHFVCGEDQFLVYTQLLPQKPMQRTIQTRHADMDARGEQEHQQIPIQEFRPKPVNKSFATDIKGAGSIA